MSRILSSLITSVWALEPSRAVAFLPLVGQVLKGETKPLSKEELASYRERLQPVRMDEGCDDTNGGTVAQPTTTAQDGRVVLVLPLKDVILKYDQSCGPYGAETYVEWLQEADRDPRVTGVVLDVDSPGGEAGGMLMLTAQLKKMKKPVVSIVRQGLAASAAYGIVACTKEVYASSSTDVFGSVGTYVTLQDWNAYYRAQGLPIEEIYASLSTDKNKPWKLAMEGKPERLIAEFLNPFNEAFINLVREARPALKASEATWSTGSTHFADEAKALGLIDGYNTLEGCIARVRALASATASTPTNRTTMSWKTNLQNALNKVFGNNEAVTAESIAAVNTEIAANGTTEVEVVAVAEALAGREAIATLATVQEQVQSLTAELATATSARDAAYEAQGKALTEVTNLTTQLAEANARIELLENEGGDEGKPSTTVGGTGDADPANKTADPKNYAHNVAVREHLKNF